MLRFKKNVEERKLLAARLGELTGIHPVYTRAPLVRLQSWQLYGRSLW